MKAQLMRPKAICFKRRPLSAVTRHNIGDCPAAPQPVRGQLARVGIWRATLLGAVVAGAFFFGGSHGAMAQTPVISDVKLNFGSPTNRTRYSFSFTASMSGTTNMGKRCPVTSGPNGLIVEEGTNTFAIFGLGEGTVDFCTVAMKTNHTPPIKSNRVDIPTFVIDYTRPTVLILDAPTIVKDKTPFPVTFQFSEPVIGFDNKWANTYREDIAVGNGDASVTTSTDGDGKTYTALITPDGKGNITIGVPASAARDLAGDDSRAGNWNEKAANPVTVKYDRVPGAPTLSEVTPVPTPGNDTTPAYTFISSEAGRITYGGDCTSATSRTGVSNETVIFNTLGDGTHSNCTIRVRDGSGNLSNPLHVSSFDIQTARPRLSEVTPVPTPGNDPTPAYTFSSNKAGDITYGGACTSATRNAAVGNNTVTFDRLGDGTHANCTIQVTDGSDNISMPLNVASFTIDRAAPTVSIKGTPIGVTDTTPFSVTFQFSEPVIGFDRASDIALGNGAASIPTSADGGITYTVDITPDGIGDIKIDVVAGVARDIADNPNEAANQVVVIYDDAPPIARAKNNTVQLDAEGKASWTAEQIDDGSSDAGGSVTLSLDITSATVPGDVAVTLTVTDDSGNTATAEATVTVEDNVGPIARAKNITVQLDAEGKASWTAEQIDDGSSDAGGSVTLSLDITSATVPGDVDVILTVTDTSGTTATATATVTVEDTIGPIARAQDITVQLDASGNASWTAEQIDDGSSDNGGGVTLSLDITSATAPGDVDVILTVTDTSGTTATATATVTVRDSIKPTINNMPADISVSVDFPDTSAVVPWTAPTATDNDGTPSLTSTHSPGATFKLGPTVVTYTATDAAGNKATASFTVTVNQTPPGEVTISVVSDVSDGTFNFDSPEPQFNFSVTAKNGEGKSPVVKIKPGTYEVTLVSLPDGFGLTSESSCGGDSVIDVGAKMATINLASGESVICTFNAVDSRTKTTETIERFLFRRGDLLLNHDPDGERQINRLVNRGGNSSNGGGLKFAGSTGGNRLPATTAFKNDASGLAGGGVPGTNVTGASGGLWSFDAPSALGAQDRQGGNPGGAMSTLPFGFSLDGDRARSFSFATSFVRMAKAAAENKQRKLGGGPEQLAALGINAGHLISPEQSDFDIWAEGHFTYFEDGTTGSETSGHFGVLYLGADYILTPNLLVGALVQIDSMEQTSSELSTEVDGLGWMAGPYLTARLSDNVFFQGRAAWGQSRNDISPFLTYTDAFDTERWLATGTLKGRWQHGAWLISPSASVGYVEERQEGYTDSLGVFIPGQTVSIGQAKFGPQISYRGAFVNGIAIEPFASLEGIWTFSEGGIDDLVVDTLAGNNKLRGKVGAGVKAVTAGGTTLAISGSYDGLGDDAFQAISGELRLAIPLQ